VNILESSTTQTVGCKRIGLLPTSRQDPSGTVNRGGEVKIVTDGGRSWSEGEQRGFWSNSNGQSRLFVQNWDRGGQRGNKKKVVGSDGANCEDAGRMGFVSLFGRQ